MKACRAQMPGRSTAAAATFAIAYKPCYPPRTFLWRYFWWGTVGRQRRAPRQRRARPNRLWRWRGNRREDGLRNLLDGRVRGRRFERASRRRAHVDLVRTSVVGHSVAEKLHHWCDRDERRLERRPVPVWDLDPQLAIAAPNDQRRTFPPNGVGEPAQQRANGRIHAPPGDVSVDILL